MVALPVDRKRLVDLNALAGLDAAATQDALVGIVAVEGVGVVLRIRLVRERARLVLYVKLRRGVVHGAVLIVVIADRAVEHVVLKDAVEGLALCNVYGFACGFDNHTGNSACATGTHKLSVDLHHAGIAGFDGAHLGQIADLRNGFAVAGLGVEVEDVDEKLAGVDGDGQAVDAEFGVRSVVGRSVE